MMKESSLYDSITKRLKLRPRLWYLKIHGSIFQRAGIPDYIGCDDGRFFAIEVKKPGEQPRKLQIVILDRIRAAGGVAGVARSADDFFYILDGGRLPDVCAESPIEGIFWQEAEWRVPSLVAQYFIEPYTVDFAVPDKKLAIEIDGKDFHSSPKAVEKDKKKDAYLSGLGWRVLRFTGSEVYSDTLRCVERVIAEIGAR
jgi:very-short-patch-repair endonuclease